MNDKKEKYLQKAIDWAKSKSYFNLKAVHDDYDPPKSFKSRHSDKTVQPDLSFKLGSGGTAYSDIALKSEETRSLVTRWKLLSLLSSMKNGKLFLLAPRGHKSFTQKLIDRYNINAIVTTL